MRLFILLLIVTLFPAIVWAQGEEDKDYPLLGRIAGYYIASYEVKEEDEHEFPTEEEFYQNVTGRKTQIDYSPENSSVKALQIRRAYTEKIKKLGGKIVFENDGNLSAQINRDGREIWVHIWCHGEADGSGGYQLTVIEKR